MGMTRRFMVFVGRQSDVTACRQRAPTSGLRFEYPFGFQLGAGRQLIIRALFGLGIFSACYFIMKVTFALPELPAKS